MKVCEVFKSLQGECLTRGAPTTFVRFAGCNLRCDWCDTAYAQGMDNAVDMSVSAVLCKMRGAGLTKLVCLTGGEPLLQSPSQLTELIEELLKREVEVITIETNGSKPIDWLLGQRWSNQIYLAVDYKLASSGVTNNMTKSNLHHLRPHDCLKFVCKDQQDQYQIVELLKTMVRVHSFNPVIFFHSLDGVPERKAAEFVLEMSDEFRGRFDIRYGDQLHKLIWGNERGR